MPVTLDLMEYANDAAAQAAYPSSDANDDVIEENFETTDSGQVLRYHAASEKLAQGFKVSNESYISKVAIQIYEVGNIAGGKKIWIYIYSDSGGVPNSALSVKSSLVEATDVAAAPEWNTFTFSTPVKLTAGVQYWIVAEGDWVISSTNYLRWCRDTAAGYADGILAYWNGSAWATSAMDLVFRAYVDALQCHSEDTIIEQGTYSLKGIAKITDSLNATLTRTVGPTIDLSDQDTIEFYIRSLRTGSNIKIGIRDSGTTTTEITPNIISANTWQKVVWNISAVSNVNKDVIDRIIITVVNAGADNTFYLDDIYALISVNALFFGCNF